MVIFGFSVPTFTNDAVFIGFFLKDLVNAQLVPPNLIQEGSLTMVLCSLIDQMHLVQSYGVGFRGKDIEQRAGWLSKSLL